MGLKLTVVVSGVSVGGGFRATLVGLKRGDLPTRHRVFSGFRATLVGLKLPGPTDPAGRVGMFQSYLCGFEPRSDA